MKTRALLLTLCIFLIIFSVSATPTQVTYTTNGTFIVPTGVNYLQELQIIGGAGTGSSGFATSCVGHLGAGGFAGTYSDLTNIPVISGHTYSIVIGSYGVSGVANATGTSAFNYTATGGINGIMSIATGDCNSCYTCYIITVNHDPNGDNGLGYDYVAQNGGGPNGAIGGTGYGAGGGGGGAYQSNSYSGGNGARGEVIITYDTASTDVFVSGFVLNAQNATPLSGATVTATQLSSSTGVTSIANGSYIFSSPFVTGFPITLTTTLSGYNTSVNSFTPYESNVLTINQTLLPSSPSTSGISYGSTVYSVPYNQPVIGATYHVVNTTSSESYTATTNGAGYANVTGLTAGRSYQIYATKDLMNSSAPVTVTAPSSSSSIGNTNLYIGQLYSGIIYVRDYSTNNPITLSVLTDELGNNVTSYGSGAFSGNYLYGSHSFTATAPNYYQNTQTYIISSNFTETILLQSLATNSSVTGIQYTTPHDVRIHVRGVFSGPVSGVNVTATFIQQSSSTTWLNAFYGVLNNPKIDTKSTVLYGTTGTDGTVNFLMIPSIQYLVTAAGQTMIIYPTDDDYTFWASGSLSSTALDASATCGNPLDTIQANATGITTSSSAGIINISYYDTHGTTSVVNIFVNQSHNYGNYTNQSTLFYSQYVGQQTLTATFNMTDPADQSYFVAVNSVSTDCGIVTRIFGVTFPPGPITLGIPVDLLPFIGFGAMIFLGLLFTRTYPGETTIAIMAWGWITFFMHWYDTQVNPAVMGSALAGWSFIAIMYNVMLRSKKPPGG